MSETARIKVSNKEIVDENGLRFTAMAKALGECVKDAVEKVETKRKLTFYGSIDLWIGDTQGLYNTTLWRDPKSFKQKQHIQFMRKLPRGEETYNDEKSYICVYLYYPIDKDGHIVNVAVVINDYRLVKGLKDDLACRIIARAMKDCEGLYMARFYTIREAIKNTFKKEDYSCAPNKVFALHEVLELGRRLGISENYIVGDALDDLYRDTKLFVVCNEEDDLKLPPSHRTSNRNYYLL